MAPGTSNDVLIVDDDRHFGEFVRATLSEAGLGAVAVPTAEEALKRAAANKPRLVIVDGLLPGMRGDELCRELRKRYDRGALPIVFLSAFFRDMKSYTSLTRDCGVDVVLHKPLQHDELLSAVLRVLPGEAAPARTSSTEIPVVFDAAPVEGVVQPLPEEVQELVPEYLAASRARVDAMRTSLTALGGAADAEARAIIGTEAHRLKGSGGSFGFPDVSRLAAELERLVTAPEPLAAADRARAAGLVDALGAKVATAQGARPIVVSRDADAELRVALVDAADTPLLASAQAANDPRLAAYSDVDALIKTFQPPATSLEELGDALNATIAQRPDVVFVACDRDAVDGKAACRRLLAAGVRPVVALTRRDALAERLKLVKSGVEGFAVRPPDADGLLRLAPAYSRRRVGASVVAIDDDPVYLQAVAELLATRDIALEPCTNPEALFQQLERSDASLVLTDVTLPGANGLDLVRALRADALYRSLPIIVVSGAGKRQDRINAFEAGADDFVQKPFVAEELLHRVLSQLDKVEQLRRAAIEDDATGAVRPRYLRETLERSLVIARRAGRTLALLGVELNGAGEGWTGALEHEVVAGAVASLKSAFRSSDLVARTGRTRLVVLLQDIVHADAEKLLGKELVTLRSLAFGPEPRPLAAKARGAAVSFPDSGLGSKALLDAVDAALEG